MTTTIIYGTTSDEGPNDDMQSSPTFLSRQETPQEKRDTEAYALAVCRKLGLPPQSIYVSFYSTWARDHVRNYIIATEPEDIQ